MAQNISVLRDIVQQTIDKGRLGEPKFLRCIAVSSNKDNLEKTIAALVSFGEALFGSPPSQRYQLGGNSGLYLTEMLKWSTGQSASITASSPSSVVTSSLDLMLVGSGGTLYYED